MTDHPIGEHLDDEGWQRMCPLATKQHKESPSNPTTRLKTGHKPETEKNVPVCGLFRIVRAFRANESILHLRDKSRIDRGPVDRQAMLVDAPATAKIRIEEMNQELKWYPWSVLLKLWFHVRLIEFCIFLDISKPIHFEGMLCIERMSMNGGQCKIGIISSLEINKHETRRLEGSEN